MGNAKSLVRTIAGLTQSRCFRIVARAGYVMTGLVHSVIGWICRGRALVVLDGAPIQAERVKATHFEDEASIEAIYQHFAHATMDTPETRELLFDYFVNKIFVQAETLTIASWFFNGGAQITHESLDEARKKGKCQRSTLPLPC